jgi:hypothetical protein
MNVLATRLSPQLSITLVDDGGGWQFSSWSTVTNRCPPLQPNADERARRFANAAEALAYFRRQYGALGNSQCEEDQNIPA